METQTYDMMREFADSWGLVYMLAICLVVVALLFRRGARAAARDAANIPLDDDTPAESPRP